MNILGHSYVSTHAVHGDNSLLIIGSLLPESFLFISNNPLTYEEIHEGGERLLKFLLKNYPPKRDLALGMITHSYESGADKWNKKIEKYAANQREELLRKIADASMVNLKTTELRLHNFLWWGVDFLILKKYPQFVKEVNQTLKVVDMEEISWFLSECFGKDKKEVLKTLRTLFEKIYRAKDLTSIRGLARTWSRQAAGLPEKDRVDVRKATKLIEQAAILVEDDFRQILDSVIEDTRKNIELFLGSGKF